MSRNKKIYICLFCLLCIGMLFYLVYTCSQNHDDDSGYRYTNIKEFEKNTDIEFYPYNDFYQFLQNKTISLKDSSPNIEIFVTFDNTYYHITPKDSFVEYSISFDVPFSVDESIYQKYDMENGKLYIYPMKQNQTTFEMIYISRKVKYTIHYTNSKNPFSNETIKEKMIEYAKYFDNDL